MLRLILTVFAVIFPVPVPQEPSGEGVVTVGTGTNCTECGDDHVPFQAALDDHLPNGGTLIVHAGSYTFLDTVTVGVPISIRGSGAVVIERNGNFPVFELQGDDSALEDLTLQLAAGDTFSEPLIRVTADRFRLDNVNLTDDAATDGMSAVQIRGNELEVRDCSFRATGSVPNAYRMLEVGDGTSLTVGTLVDGNTFAFDAAAGAVGVWSRRGRGVRIRGNEFRGPLDGSGNPVAGDLAHAIRVEDNLYGAITGNVFYRLGTGAPGTSIIDVSNVLDIEGHHIAISGNFFEETLADTVLRLEGARFNSISGNVFGRGRRAVDLVGGSGNSFSSNQVHNMGAGGLTPIRVTSHTNLSISSNQFALCRTLQIEIAADSVGAHIVGNQFASGDPGGGGPQISEAILLEGPNPGAGHFVHDNSAVQGGSLLWTQLLSTPGLVPADYDAAGNVVF